MTTLLTSTATRGLGFSPTIRRAVRSCKLLNRPSTGRTRPRPHHRQSRVAEGRIGQSDRLIVEFVGTGSTPVVILIRQQLSMPARKRAGASFLIMTRLPLRSLTGLS
jgi:hypothetical protein